MKKILTLALVTCLTACSVHKALTPPALPDISNETLVFIDPVNQELKVGDMKVTVPLSWSVKDKDSGSITLLNKDKANIIIMEMEYCPGTYNQCLRAALHEVVSTDGINLLEIEETSIDDQKIVLVSVLKGNVNVWSWITYKNNFVYMLSCGGLSEDKKNETLCADVAKTIKFK